LVPFAVLAFVLSLIMKEIPLRTTAQGSVPATEGTEQAESPLPAGDLAAL
jgi:hypothetical protein